MLLGSLGGLAGEFRRVLWLLSLLLQVRRRARTMREPHRCMRRVRTTSRLASENESFEGLGVMTCWHQSIYEGIPVEHQPCAHDARLHVQQASSKESHHGHRQRRRSAVEHAGQARFPTASSNWLVECGYELKYPVQQSPFTHSCSTLTYTQHSQD